MGEKNKEKIEKIKIKIIFKINRLERFHQKDL